MIAGRAEKIGEEDALRPCGAGKEETSELRRGLPGDESIRPELWGRAEMRDPEQRDRSREI